MQVMSESRVKDAELGHFELSMDVFCQTLAYKVHFPISGRSGTNG